MENMRIRWRTGESGEEQVICGGKFSLKKGKIGRKQVNQVEYM